MISCCCSQLPESEGCGVLLIVSYSCRSFPGTMRLEAASLASGCHGSTLQPYFLLCFPLPMFPVYTMATAGSCSAGHFDCREVCTGVGSDCDYEMYRRSSCWS